MIIAITGCIGSGKSFISNRIHTLGYDTYSCDDFVMEAYEDETIKNNLNNVFKCVKDGKVNKAVIKSQLNDENIIKLNNIIHPYVIMKIQKLKDSSINKYIFIEVPLLFEINLQSLFDKTIAISVDENLRHERLKKRNGNAYEDMLKLEKRQLSNDEKAKRADFVIYSSEDDNNTYHQIDVLIKNLKGVSGYDI